MPYSSVEGKGFVRDFFADKWLLQIVDVGPGAGTYRDLLRSHDAWWTAVEIWAPYVTQFGLREKYNEVVIADAAWIDWDLLGRPDLVIFGDVLEHMPYEQASQIVAKAVARATYVLIALPIIHYPQGTEMGNPYEAHVQHYTPSSVRELLLDDYTLLAYDEQETVGTYIIQGDPLHGIRPEMLEYYKEQDKGRRE
jgi:hypothetical protein